MKSKFLPAFLFLCLLPLPVAFAGDDTSPQNAPEKAASSAEVKSAEEAKPAPTPLEIVTAKIVQEPSVAEQAIQAKRVAGELREAEVQHETLTKKVASISTDSEAAPLQDPEILLKAKLAFSDLKKNYLERKEGFLREKIELQKFIHQKLQDYLKTVFSEDASFFVINNEIKELRKRRAARRVEMLSLSREISPLSNRIAVETKYLSAKDALLASITNDESKRAYMLETLALAEGRLQILQDTKALLEEELDFLNSRISGNDEFDKLIRVRRSEVFSRDLNSRKRLPYHAREAALSLLTALFLAGLFLLRKRLMKWINGSAFILQRNVYGFILNVILFLGLASLVIYGGLNLSGYRFAAITLGLLYLNVSGGLVVFSIVSLAMEGCSSRLIQKVTKTSQAEIINSSAVYSLANVFFKVFAFLTISSQILFYWAIRREVTEFLLSILNYPVFRGPNAEISLWILGRSVLAFWIFHWLSRFINSVLKTHIYPKTSLDRNSRHAIQSVIQFVFMVLGFTVSIQLLGIDMSALAVFSGTLGLGIGLGLQDIIKNIVSGFVIYFERPIRIGDIVEVGNTPGMVKSIRTRSTVINTYDNISIVVPNSEFLSQRVVNWSLSDRAVRIESRVGVAYGSDVELVRQILMEITKANKRILQTPEPIVVFEDFADSALLFRVLFWVILEDRMEVKSAVNFAINAKFNEKGIVIPFPQRDIHIKSSDFELTKKT